MSSNPRTNTGGKSTTGGKLVPQKRTANKITVNMPAIKRTSRPTKDYPNTWPKNLTYIKYTKKKILVFKYKYLKKKSSYNYRTYIASSRKC